MRIAGRRGAAASHALQPVAELFQRRNGIVHARPRRVEVYDYGLRVDPKLCLRSLVAVADCVLVLNDCLAETDIMGRWSQPTIMATLSMWTRPRSRLNTSTSSRRPGACRRC